MAAKKKFEVVLVPADTENSEFIDADGKQRNYIRNVTLMAGSAEEARELAIEKEAKQSTQYVVKSVKDVS